MSIIAIIPARGGSKAIPHKNIIPLAGRPLIDYTIKSACNASVIDRVLVSTDDMQIAEIARKLGAEIPFIRPSELSGDNVPMIDVLQHALNWLDTEGELVSALVLLQPTSPLRTDKHIEDAVGLFNAQSASSVVSVVKVPHQYNPVSVLKKSNEGLLIPFLSDQMPITRRQDKPEIYARNGPAVLVCHPNIIRHGDLYGEKSIPYLMTIYDSLDVDEPEDLTQIELILKSRY